MTRKKSKSKWKLVTSYPIKKYKCGLKAGDKLRLKEDLAIRDHKGKSAGQISQAGGIWAVLPGSKEPPVVVWLRQPDGVRHTWDDDKTIFETFEVVKEEVFDVVNELDEVISLQTRREVHRLGLKHRAVHVLVFNSRGQVFLQKRSMSKDTFPGAWDSSAAGHLDCGEEYDVCAVRELGEELGLKVKACPRRLFKIEACAETGQEFVWVYRCESEGPFKLHPEEIECGEWFEPEFVTKWIARKPGDFASAFVLIWKRLTTNGHG